MRLINENKVAYELCMRQCFILAKSLDIRFNSFYNKQIPVIDQ